MARLSYNMRNVIRSTFVVLATVPVFAQAPAPTRAQLDALGPKVGDAAPSFTLRDQRGEERTLKSILGPKGAMLVFFRSADW